MKGGLMNKGDCNPVPPEIQAEIDALAASQEPIRTDLIPEAGDWSQARRGVFYRPLKQQITLSLDADLIDWFKTQATQEEGYQTSINRALREYVETRAKK
ncbi:MAG: BrnA antitoxin family protein [Microcystis aeruginosa K13-06]|nr:BrnA antitoxin family protein [Microcystis aeruginosa K13-06]